jgi:hypothetical protein
MTVTGKQEAQLSGVEWGATDQPTSHASSAARKRPLGRLLVASARTFHKLAISHIGHRFDM